MTNIKRGEVYYANLDPVVGSEQGGRRPVLIIQNDTGNHFSPTTVVAPITTKKKRELPTHISVGEVQGLYKDSIVMLEQVRTIDKQRIQKYCTKIDQKHMRMVERAMAKSCVISQDNIMVITLCQVCADQYRNIVGRKIRRIGYQSERDTCCYCNYRKGYDYQIIETN